MPHNPPNPKYQAKPKKRPRIERYSGIKNIPELPILCVESVEEEEEVYYNNQSNDQNVRIVFGKKGKRGHGARFPIARREFRRLCQFMPRGCDLAAWFKVDEETLLNWAKRAFPEFTFKSVAQLVGQLGSTFTFGLRRIMWDHAQKSPNAAMFLCKNYIGLKESPQDEGTNLQVETINYHFPNDEAEKRWKSPKENLDQPIILPAPIKVNPEPVGSEALNGDAEHAE